MEESLLSPIKQLCKIDDQSTINALHYLSIDLKRKNGCVRMRSLCIINELFKRSKVFRKEISQNISIILGCGGFLHRVSNEVEDSSRCTSFKVEVENKVKELIEIWDSSYGMMYPEIHTASRYLKETLKVSMPNIEVSLCNYYCNSNYIVYLA